jgi:hypothetical protein
LAEWLPAVRFISAKGNPAGDASYPRRTILRQVLGCGFFPNVRVDIQ